MPKKKKKTSKKQRLLKKYSKSLRIGGLLAVFGAFFAFTYIYKANRELYICKATAFSVLASIGIPTNDQILDKACNHLLENI